MLVAVVLFALLFPLNVLHLRWRRVPVYSLGTTIAVIHLVGGCVFHPFLVPVIAVVAAGAVELWVNGLAPPERERLDRRFAAEEQAVEERIDQAQRSYEDLYCLASFTAEQEWQLRDALKRLDSAGVPYYLRNGPLTSVLIRPADQAAGEAALGIEGEPLAAPADAT